MKHTKCKLRLHGCSREILTGEFDSITAAKKWINDCWDRPYTIVKLNNLAATDGNLKK
jgi:hypothetical protein